MNTISPKSFKFSLETDEINFYCTSLVLGLLHFMKSTKNYQLGIWTLGIPLFKSGLERNDLNKDLIAIIDVFDELEALHKLGKNMDKIIEGLIGQAMKIMDIYNTCDIHQIALFKK